MAYTTEELQEHAQHALKRLLDSNPSKIEINRAVQERQTALLTASADDRAILVAEISAITGHQRAETVSETPQDAVERLKETNPAAAAELAYTLQQQSLQAKVQEAREYLVNRPDSPAGQQRLNAAEQALQKLGPRPMVVRSQQASHLATEAASLEQRASLALDDDARDRLLDMSRQVSMKASELRTGQPHPMRQSAPAPQDADKPAADPTTDDLAAILARAEAAVAASMGQGEAA